MTTGSERTMPDEARNGARKLPLEGVRVLDISNFMAAPATGMYLADYGAEVIKFERPGKGDELRAWGYTKDGVPLTWKILNRNKKAIQADFHTPLGIEILKRLVREADVVIENYRPGTLEKWGIGYDVLREINPGIILLRVTGYGQTGPNSHKPGFGTAMEAYSGGVYMSGYPDRPPLLPGFGLADMTTGVMGAFLVLAALHERDAHSGIGQVIDLPLYETLMTILGPFISDYDQLGLVYERSGSRAPWTAPRNVYRCKDGKYVAISGSGQAVFERLCGALGIPDLPNDPRFAGHRDRLTNVQALDDALQEQILRFDRDDAVEAINASGAVCAPVRSVAEIFEDPHILERESIKSIPDAELGHIVMQNVVGKFSRTPGSIRSTGPTQGQHNQEILVERMGYTRKELEAAGIYVIDDEPAKAEVGV